MDETKADETQELQWHRFKDRLIFFRGDEILGIVEPIADFPCRAFGLHLLHTMYTSEEAAKAEAEKSLKRLFENQALENEPPQNIYLDILKQVVAALEAKAKKPE